MRRKKDKRKIKSKKVTYAGREFDSLSECEFYKILEKEKENKKIKDFQHQVAYILLESFFVPCKDCKGSGKETSEKTGNLIQCKKCKGKGEKKRQGWKYTADFVVHFHDGTEETIDVKGGYVNERFPLTKKMFEFKYNQELVVMEKTRLGWKRK